MLPEMYDMGLPGVGGMPGGGEGGVPSALEAAMRLAQDPHGASRGASLGLPPSRVSAPSPSLPPTTGLPPTAGLPPSGDTPRLTLKDYLPFMKPKSFGGDKAGPKLDAAAAMGAIGGYPSSMPQVYNLSLLFLYVTEITCINT